ncbi:hypothetical protein AB0C52_04010 [Streptomyces sp. NPDC048717]|uniref:hypothetical protein n=1 Tax=Streptomyces sp. NPDC048717 TaxID=3154928 RepID=UPI003412CB9A
MSEPRRVPVPARRGRAARFTAAFSVLAGLAAYVTLHDVTGSMGAPRCVIGGGDARYEFTPEQASNAATIAAVGSSRGLPERAVTIALATALQESALRNIEHGDRDSLGLFQQRPSQGWGTPEQILDPVYSSTKFYEGLEKVPGYSRLPLTVAAQKVQRSGFPQAYAKHEPDATLLSAALTGRAQAALACTADVAETEGRPGDPRRVRDELVKAFGAWTAPKVETAPEPGAGAPGAGARGTAAGKNAVTGPAELSVPVHEARVPRTERGWALAQWAVARADELRIAEVAYGDRIWVANTSSGDWKPVRGDKGVRGTDGSSVRLTLAR